MSEPLLVLGIIPARGGSKSIPRKNIRPLGGKPLLAYTIEEARKSCLIQRLVLTTDDEEIARIGREVGAEVPFIRPSELAGDSVTDLPVFQHCLEWMRSEASFVPDIVVHLRATAPLRRVEHIDRGIRLLVEHPEADAVRSVCTAGQHPLKMWRIEGERLHPYIPEHVFGIAEAYNRPRQKLPTAFVQNGSVDVVRASVITEGHSMTGTVILPLVMDEDVSVNIDSATDWRLAEIMMGEEAAKNAPPESVSSPGTR